jgi:hypothetical protein
MRCYATWVSSWLPTFRKKLLVPSWRFKHTKTKDAPWIVWSLNMGPRDCPETSVTNYQHRPCNISEERRPLPHCGGGLESHILLTYPYNEMRCMDDYIMCYARVMIIGSSYEQYQKMTSTKGSKEYLCSSRYWCLILLHTSYILSAKLWCHRVSQGCKI